MFKLKSFHDTSPHTQIIAYLRLLHVNRVGGFRYGQFSLQGTPAMQAWRMANPVIYRAHLEIRTLPKPKLKVSKLSEREPNFV